MIKILAVPSADYTDVRALFGRKGVEEKTLDLGI